MYFLRPTAIAMVFLCLFGCRQRSDNNDETATTAQSTTTPEQLKFDIKSIRRTSGDCNADSTNCAKIEISYPVATGGPEKLQHSINQYVQHRLQKIKLDFNPDADTAATADAAQALAEYFLAQRQQFIDKMKQNPAMLSGASLSWELQVKGESVYTSPSVVSLQFDGYSFSGGAHGNPFTILQSFDSTGHALSLTDMISDTVQLRLLAEQQFRKVRKELVGDKPLSEAGLFIDGNTLPLAQNYALVPGGFLLYYNAYEIGPYVMGSTEVLLPYTQLQGLLRPAYQP